MIFIRKMSKLFKNNLQKCDRKRNWTTQADIRLPYHLAIRQNVKKMKKKCSEMFFAADLNVRVVFTIWNGVFRHIQKSSTKTHEHRQLLSYFLHTHCIFFHRCFESFQIILCKNLLEAVWEHILFAWLWKVKVNVLFHCWSFRHWYLFFQTR